MSPKCLCNSSSLSSSLVQPTCFQSVYFCLSSSLLTAQGCFYDSHNSRSSIIMNESVSRIITNDTIKFVSQTAISILVISNHNSFQVLFDRIASVYFFENITFVPYRNTACLLGYYCSYLIVQNITSVRGKFAVTGIYSITLRGICAFIESAACTVSVLTDSCGISKIIIVH